MPDSQLTYQGLADILLERMVEASFPTLNFLLLQGRVWGLEECEWQMEVPLPVVRQAPVRPRLQPLMLKKYRNVMEELTVDAVREQIAGIEDDYIKECIDSNQVIAYALNRLQPMYATTEEGWLNMRKHALDHSELIQRAVAQAIQVVQATPRPSTRGIHRNKPTTPALMLSRLSKLVGKNNMRWRDLPDALQRKLDKKTGHLRYQGIAYEIRSYLKRSKMRESRPNDMYLVDFGMVEADWFKVYMSEAMGDYLNVLEQLVYDNVVLQLEKPEYEGKEVNFDEIMAFALNRLPSMYATSETGIEQLRTFAMEHLQERIGTVVNDAIFRVTQNPRFDVHPLPFSHFEKELEFALRELRQILNRTDVTWENLYDIIKVEFERRGITIPLSARY
jgi:plasmid maintenance system antidote protein VapI